MKKLIILVGPPGSGKSTTAKSFMYAEYTYINQDSQGKDGHLKFFMDALLADKNIVVDRLNFNKQQRERYLIPAKGAGYETEIVVLHESYGDCLNRCLNRKDHETIKDSQSAHSALNTFFSKYERVQDDEADKVTRIWPENSNKSSAIWIDIDNTLSDATHREHYLQGPKKNWTGFFSEMSNDPMNGWCKQILLAMRSVGYDILICSGRPDNYREQTVAWLTKNNISPHFYKLFMRPRSDSRPDYIAKEIMYEFEVKTKYDLLFSIDDRKQVIDKIREHGVLVLDCAGPKGNF